MADHLYCLFFVLLTLEVLENMRNCVQWLILCAFLTLLNILFKI